MEGVEYSLVPSCSLAVLAAGLSDPLNDKEKTSVDMVMGTPVKVPVSPAIVTYVTACSVEVALENRDL